MGARQYSQPVDAPKTLLYGANGGGIFMSSLKHDGRLLIIQEPMNSEQVNNNLAYQ